MAPPPPSNVLAAFGLDDQDLIPITTGLINRTFLARQGAERRILQRVNPIFSPEVNEDIEAVTDHLAGQGLETPRLIRTRAGEPWCADDDGGIWRVLTHVDAETIEKVDSPARAGEAGALLGRFHTALRGLDHAFKQRRPGVHDTPAHLRSLCSAVDEHQDHSALAQVAPVAREILKRAQALPELPDLPHRVVHGDPKISNVIFGPGGRARCLVDLDTLSRMPAGTHLELGDALRSWCNPAGEEQPGTLDMELAGSALEGYAATAPRPTPAELDALPVSVGLISLELAARFCADALQERYFGWDAARFPSASAHNLVRARSQLALARSADAALSELARLVAALWP